MLVTFAAHRIRHLCAHLTQAVERGVESNAVPVQQQSNTKNYYRGMEMNHKPTLAVIAAVLFLSSTQSRHSKTCREMALREQGVAPGVHSGNV